MDTETGGDTAPRESTPAPKPEENREYGSVGHREDEERKHVSQSGDLHRDDLPERNRHREARAESSVEQPVFEREPRMDRQSDRITNPSGKDLLALSIRTELENVGAALFGRIGIFIVVRYRPYRNKHLCAVL